MLTQVKGIIQQVLASKVLDMSSYAALASLSREAFSPLVSAALASLVRCAVAFAICKAMQKLAKYSRLSR